MGIDLFNSVGVDVFVMVFVIYVFTVDLLTNGCFVLVNMVVLYCLFYAIVCLFAIVVSC